MIVERKPRIGLLLIGSPRFKPLGEGTAHGTYEARKLREEKEIIGEFQEIGEIVTPGIVYEREDVTKAIDLFLTRKVDCVAAAYLSWAEDFAWIRFLRDMPPVPLFFTSIIRDRVEITDTNDEDEFVEFLSAGSLVGVQEASGDLQRFHRPMTHTFIGTMGQVKKELGVFAQAALCRSQLRSSTLGLLASNNEAMWSTSLHPYLVFMKAGPELRFLSVAQLTEKIGSVPKDAVEEAVRGIEERFRISANVDREKLAASVRASIALEELSGDYGIDLTVLNDIDPVLLGSVGLRPGFCPTRGDSRLTVVPEGDIGGGLAVYILKLLSGRRANFIEPFYIIHQRNRFAAGHAGPNDYTQCPGNVVVARDERFAKTEYRYAGAPFAWYVFPQGEKTMLHMSEKDGVLKMVCTLVEAAPTKHYLASYSHSEFRHQTLSPQELFQRLVSIGVTQHYAIVDGDWTKELEELARLMGFDFYKI